VAARRRRLFSRRRWSVAVVVVAVGVALLVDGFVRHEVGRSSTATSAAPVPLVPGAGPIVDLSGAEPQSPTIAERTVALTFDDGPDPTWTPRILDVLRRHQVPATFFVVGAAAAAHPDLIRAEVAAGHEVGAHTFTHTDLGAASTLRATAELTLTQTALAGAAGINTRLLRLPYSSSAAAVAAREVPAARRAGRLGYVLVFATEDGEDWRRPGPAVIAAHSTPLPGQGGVVLLHDGGGDRSQTVDALDRLITTLQGRGYRFTTVSGIAGLHHDAMVHPVGLIARLQGRGLLLALYVATAITRLFALLLIAVGVLALARAAAVLSLARRHARQARPPAPGPFLPPVSVIVPAYNEEVGIAAAVASLAANDHPHVEIVVVDDGSTDRTAEIVAALDDEKVRLIRQANSGKPAALNTGIAAARHEIVVLVDGDTIFEPDTIRQLVAPLADDRVGAVSGNTKVGNRRGLLGRWQHIEYVMGFNLDRRMHDLLFCLPTVPGAAGAFRREALADVGGVSADTLAEDTDLTMALNRAGWRVVYAPDARAWTEAPATLGQLWRQRYRWCYGTLQAAWKHRQAVTERTPLGVVGLPYLILFQVLVPLLAPIIDLFGLYGLVFLDPVPVAACWLAFNAVQMGLAAYAFHLDGEPLRPLWAVPLQQLVYRQLMYLVVIESVGTAISGRRLRWHKLHRTGDVLALPGGATPPGLA
jgi:cellulose synthase/poly-beta-1,6-N-acetylglucosamine synthase-like glycosyltransferase/peptidoglycan/xylan/chitin deacetylase (PgdA/CDA1 family)